MGGGVEKQKASPRIHKIPESIRNFPFLPIRGDPWGSGGRPLGVPIKAQHPTRKREINEAAAGGWRRKENEMKR